MVAVNLLSLLISSYRRRRSQLAVGAKLQKYNSLTLVCLPDYQPAS